MRKEINQQKETEMAQMVELIGTEIKSYYKQIQYIQEDKGNNEHTKKIYGRQEKGATQTFREKNTV